jgi:hypothetical protein
MPRITIMEAQGELLENLRKYKTVAELRKSAFFADRKQLIESLLTTPQLYSCPAARPRIQSFLRIAQWNIEKGKHFEAILDRLQTDAIVRWADVIILNEADYGMRRSQNRYVARSLAEDLGMHMAFAPAHLELTMGTADELMLEGENHESLQGNAILSRHPILEAFVVPLPVTFEPYEFHETLRAAELPVDLDSAERIPSLDWIRASGIAEYSWMPRQADAS